jgi:lysophospholipase L1-like esterase
VIAGVNDIYQHRPAGAVIRELETIFDRAARERRRLPIVAGSILPFDSATVDQNTCMAAVNEWIRAYAADSAHVEFCDTRAAVAAPSHPDRLVSSPDGLHPSPEGYRLLAAALEPVILRAFARAPSQARRLL